MTIPLGKSFAILVPVECERPGYDINDPPYTVSHWEIETFPNKEVWLTEIKRREGLLFNREPYQAVILSVPKVTSTVSVEIKTDD